MTQPELTANTLPAADGRTIPVYCWQAPEIRGVIHLLHGLGEYAQRYERFATAATAAGFAVVAHDHRGHGAQAEIAGYFGAAGGWTAVLDDISTIDCWLRERFEGLPVVLLGHSMGSYLAQLHAAGRSGPLAGLLLSASTWPSRLQVWPGRLVARLICWRQGAQERSALLDKLGFGAFNKPFEPARTNFDWLSRDAAEVDRYIADPLCGGPFTNQLWVDLLGGLLDVSTTALLEKIDTRLPILITGGAQDPVGGDRGMGELAAQYAATGHQHLRVKIYPEGRHEMLNETNRDDVTADWLAWMSEQV